MEFPDLVAIDRDENPILLVDVKSHRVSAAMAREILHGLRAITPTIPMGENVSFGMIVDPVTVSLYDLRPESIAWLGELKTEDVLGRYSSRFREFIEVPLVARDFLGALVDVWVQDIIFRWKTKAPPGLELFESTGLLEKLQGGWIGRYPLTRLVDAVH